MLTNVHCSLKLNYYKLILNYLNKYDITVSIYVLVLKYFLKISQMFTSSKHDPCSFKILTKKHFFNYNIFLQYFYFSVLVQLLIYVYLYILFSIILRFIEDNK